MGFYLCGIMLLLYLFKGLSQFNLLIITFRMVRISFKLIQLIICFLFIDIYNCTAQTVSLDFFIQKAKNNSPLLVDYDNQIAINRTDSLILTKSYGLQLFVNSNDYYAPVVDGMGYDEIVTNIGSFNALFTASKEITGKNTKLNAYQSFDLKNQALTNLSRISEQDLALKVAEQYINAYAGLKQWERNRKLLELLNKEGEIYKKLTEENIYKQTDYLSFIITIQQQQFLVSQSEIGYYNDLYTLYNICGIVDTMYLELGDPNLVINLNSFYINSIFQQQFQLDSLIVLNEDEQIDLNYKPKLNVYADAGYNSSFQFNAYKNFGASIGVNLTIPIYDGGQRNLQHRKSQLKLETIYQYNQFAKSQFEQQIITLNRQLRSNATLKTYLDTEINYMETLLISNSKLLSVGEIGIPEYILMVNNYRNIQSQYIQLDLQKYQIINQLNYYSASR